MVELSNERIEQMLKDETKKTENLLTILRGIYTRYMNLYERYFADLGELNDDRIAEFGKYHEETQSLIRYYYMDIPQDVCTGIREFEEKVSDRLLGREWKKNLYDTFDEFREKSKVRDRCEDYYKEEFSKQALKAFYEAMENIFRDGFGTASQTVKEALSGISGLLFGKKEK
jgi:hypothetical protein